MRESQQKMILDILSTGQRVTVRQLATKPVYSMYGGKRLSELKERGIKTVSYTHLRAPRDGLLSRMPSSA